MRILVIGDLHISDQYIKELEPIMQEIWAYPADLAIQLGDFYDSRQPTPKSLEFGTYVAKELVDKYREVHILSGTNTHDKLNGVSIVSYLKQLGVKTETDELIYNNMLFGHFCLNESVHSYGHFRYGLKDIKQYYYTFLGHQHSWQMIGQNVWHLGSVFWKSFGEIEDKSKKIAIIDTNKLDVEFIDLKSPIPMKDCYSLEEINRYKSTHKVRMVFDSFEVYKDSISSIKDLHIPIKINFKKEITEIKKDINIKELTIKHINNIKNEEVKKLLLEVL